MKKSIMNYQMVALIVVLAAALSACGGGGSSAPNLPANSYPIANAGADQNISTGSMVILDGSTSSDADFDALTYSWTIITAPTGSSASLSDPTAVTPYFTADLDGTYVIKLWVNDGAVNSMMDDSVTITASSTNSAPVANAGVDQNAQTGSLVTLDGSASSDADLDSLTYSWALSSAPNGSTAILDPSNSVTPQFTANVDGIYIITLVVNDGSVNSVEDIVTVTASTGNSDPVANAGANQNVDTGSLVTLDGSASSDADLDTLTYAWTITTAPGGSSASLSNAATASPTFTADIDGSYVITLVVNDGTVDSIADSVAINATTPVDTFLFKYTTYVEAGLDPDIVGIFSTTENVTYIMLTYGSPSNQFALKLWGQTAGNYNVSGVTSSATFTDSAGNIYYATQDINTSAYITISEFGAVGQRIKGTYAVTLCEWSAIQTGQCSNPLNRVTYTGSFGVTREPDM